jgi:hypothetical protein
MKITKMSSMMPSVIMAINVTSQKQKKAQIEKVQVEKQLNKIEQEIKKTDIKMKAMESIWWDDNKVWLSMY